MLVNVIVQFAADPNGVSNNMSMHLMNGDEGAYKLSHLYDLLIQNMSSSTSSDVTSEPASSGSARSAVIHH